MDSSEEQARIRHLRGEFATTHWSLVIRAGRRGSQEAEEALAILCQRYWYPLYAYVRRLGRSTQDAQDLTQEFFARVLEKNYLAVADRERGKFRSFLLTAFKHFLTKEKDRERAQKRGGGRPLISLDFASGESRYFLEPAHEWTPEKIYERRWALTLLDQVLARLREESVRAGKAKLFDRLKVFLTGAAADAPYKQVAAELDLTEGAVKAAIHRLRRHFRELVREEIAQTVVGPEEIEEELRHLFAALGSEKS